MTVWRYGLQLVKQDMGIGRYLASTSIYSNRSRVICIAWSLHFTLFGDRAYLHTIYISALLHLNH